MANVAARGIGKAVNYRKDMKPHQVKTIFCTLGKKQSDGHLWEEKKSTYVAILYLTGDEV
jgi:hypothetical protein